MPALAGALLALAVIAPAARGVQDRPTTAGGPQVEAAVKRALDALQASQKPDGAWEASFGRATSVTSLAVMAFLACGHTPDVPGPYRETIERGIRFVIASQKPNGLLVASTSHGPMYCHGAATLMLAEVVGMTTDPALAADCRAALAKAVDLIIKAQNIGKDPESQGGWRYQPTSRDSDLSVSGWQVLALRAANAVGCAVPAENIDRAVAYFKRCAVPSGGFAYQPGGAANSPRTGVGILALELCGEHRGAESLAGAAYLMRHPPQWSSQYFFYEVYYVPQALFQLGDDDLFRPYFNTLTAILLEHQDRDGSWLSGDGNDRTGGRDYCTAMAVLALAVEYRYLPIYQRGADHPNDR